MSSTVVSLTYGASALLALAALYFFHARHWYWHVAAVLVALVLGLLRLPEGWNRPEMDLVVGAVIVFLLFWGILAPFFRVPHAAAEGKHRHA